MPPRMALSSRAVRYIQSETYVCPSCLFQDSIKRRPAGTARTQQQATRSYTSRPRDPRIPWTRAQQPINSRRYASNGPSLASSTAINAPSTVPPELRELHQQLLLLQDKASSYVDLSRLQLALRSLESEDPILRVAFLGLGVHGVRAARRLAKVLLGDELGDEAPWERQLLEEDEGRSILIRYGDASTENGVQGSSTPLVKEMSIPSPRLKRWNIEIMVTGLNASGYAARDPLESAEELEESILVPPITIPGAGRVGFVRYPVHKALIVAEGISGAVEFGRLPNGLADGKLINAALSIPLRAEKEEAHGEERVSGNAIDIDLAEHALALFRKSNANGAVYGEKWQTSRMTTVSNWLAAAANTEDTSRALKPAVADMLNSVLSRAENRISSAETAAEASSTALTIPDAKRTTLQSAIATWSEEAHRDLQTNFSASLLSPTWRRTTWWRLFWRIDEVSISASDVLRRGWLVEAEQSLAFLSGRILEAGLASAEQLKGEHHRELTVEEVLGPEAAEETKDDEPTNQPPHKVPTVAELLQTPILVAKVKEQSGLDAMFDPPWPQTIHLARQLMLHEHVPAMHRRAQALLLASLSTIGGSGALAGWLWVASGGVALYEAGAIAALGLVWSLRRLQKKWSTERDIFTDTAREDARRVLADIEGRLKKLVQDGGRVAIREEDRKEWMEARDAIRAAREVKSRIVKA